MKGTTLCFWAHSENAEGHRHSLRDHLSAVAVGARSFARAAIPNDEDFAGSAYWAGLLHDFGKYSDLFQRRLADPSIHGVDHWSAGALALAEAGQVSAAYAVYGHHVGIPDSTTIVNLKKSKMRHLPGQMEELKRRRIEDGLPASIAKGKPPAGLPTENCLLTRLAFSCLVDADFLDTERHFEPEQSRLRETASRSFLAAEWLDRVLNQLESLSRSGSSVNPARQDVLRQCLARAAEGPGLFSLTVPTGGGKTLAALAFALKHTVANPRLNRVIVVLPYTSIIEQTAEIYAKILGPDAILEHHSSREIEAPEQERRYRLAAQNWDAPVIVTTQVQFFESLFSNRSSACRKLHRIANSVIILDEVQTLTGALMRPLLAMIQELCATAGCSALLATATPNALGAAAEKLGLPGWSPREIIPDPSGLAAKLRRVTIAMPADYSRATPLAHIAQEMAAAPQALCIVNRKDDAEDLYRLLPTGGRYHISTRMCPAHRAAILAEVKAALAAGKACRLAATQCVEAGVDLDFPSAWRALAPLDSILQAAGRCNREGSRSAEGSRVKVFLSERQPPRGYYRAATAVTSVFSQLGPVDILDPNTILEYYRLLFGRIGLDHVCLEDGRETTVSEMERQGHFAAIGDSVRLIKEETVPVVVRYGRSGKAAERYLKWYARKQGSRPVSGAVRRRLSRLSVGMYRREAARLTAEGVIHEFSNGCLLWLGHYDQSLGCVTPKPEDLVA